MVSDILLTVAVLEMTSGIVGVEQPMGVIIVKLSEEGDFDDAAIKMATLSASLLHRFERLGDLSDLENSISNMAQAVECVDDGHPSKPTYLLDLGNGHQRRFEYLGELFDIEKAIYNKAKAVDLIDDGYLDKPWCLSSLGCSLYIRFQHCGDLSDLENAISKIAKAVEHTDDSNPKKPAYLSNLSLSQLRRFECLGDPSDLENAVSCLEKIVALTDGGHPNAMVYLSNLGIAQETRFKHFGNLSDLDNAILNKAKAVQLTNNGNPRKPMSLSNLGNSQITRFKRSGDLSDLDNSILNHEKAVKLTDDAHPDKPMFLSNLGANQQDRFKRFGNLYDLKNAISNIGKAAELTDDRHPNKIKYLSNLGYALESRFEHLSDLPDIENAISNQEKAVELTPDGHPDKAWCLSNLSSVQRTRFQHLGDLSNLEGAITNIEAAVELTDDEDTRKPMYICSLGISQQFRFERLGSISDLENALSNHAKAVELRDDGQRDKSMYLSNLGISQRARFEQFREQADLTACISSFQAAAQLKAADPHQALFAARNWAETSHTNGDLPSALDGYRICLELLPKVAWLGLNIPSRQSQLLRHKPENLACLAATCAIQLGHLEEAVELLDLGRSVLWQQASSLRGDLEMLRQIEPGLAEEFERLGQQLDAGNFSHSDFAVKQHSTEDIGNERRHLVGMWEDLLERIRQLVQFKYFLKPLPFRQLRQISADGQVIIINASTHGVDALIFGVTGPIEHVSLSNVDFETLTELSSNIVLMRPAGASAAQRRNYVNRFLGPALRQIWRDILIDIFNKIHLPYADIVMLPQRRIWWYLTGPLTFIPIHAAGPGRGLIDVSRLVISSYITTLQSLFRVQKTNGSASKGQRKLLSISQPETPGQCVLPQTVGEVDKVAQVFISSGWSKEDIVCLNGSEATVDRVSCALNSCSWVHLACHGYQHPILGLKSAFALHDGHLELHEIASKRLSNGKFAFISACHAASGLKDLPGEAIHLAAGLQFAGFPSVIATMWAIRDEDAPKVADHTYRYLFRNGLEELNPSDAAIALNRAVLHLREDPNVSVDKWAPFVHFGI